MAKISTFQVLVMDDWGLENLKDQQRTMSIREKIIWESVQGLDIDSRWIKRLSENEHIPPALLNQSVNVTRLILSEKKVNSQKTLKHILNNKLNLLGIQF